MKRSLIFLLIIFTVSSIANAAIVKHPYLIYPGTNTEMTVLWQLDSTRTCTLEWGTSTSYSGGSTTTTEYGTDHQHKHNITILTPGTKYFYRVVEDANHTGTFCAAPANSAENVKFFAYGDTRNRPHIQDSINEQMITEYTADPNYQTISLFSGDFVDRGRTESSWTDQWFNPSYPNMVEIKSNLPFNGAIGNHETNFLEGEDDGDLFMKYYPYPYLSEPNKYWSFDYGPVHVIILDQYDTPAPLEDLGAEQLTWLENDLIANTKDWTFIVLHKPGYVGGGGESDVRNNLQPLCEQYGVQMVIAGDTHVYDRSMVNGVTHITTGGGGAPLYTAIPWGQYVQVAESVYHFCKIDIQGTALFFEAVRIDGTLVDSFTLDFDTANYPSPKDEAIDVGRKPALSWTPGRYVADANGHKVHFGATTSPPLVDDPCQPQTATNYMLDTVLEPNTTYYWAVDEVNSATSPYLWPGYLWSFTTAEYVTIDDFEDYSSSTGMQAVWVEEAMNSNMTTALVQPAFGNYINGGLSAMKFSYNNTASPYYSGIERTYSSAQDWTAGNIKALQLSVHGTVGNDITEQMYLRLEDADGNDATVIYGADPKYQQDPNVLDGEMGGEDANYLPIASPQTWYIDLLDFVDANDVDLTQIKKIAIGFGDGSAPSGDATGDVFFDDIRLYMPRCISEYAFGDFTGDCESTYEDLNVIADEWLKTDHLFTNFDGVLDPCFSGTQWVTGVSGNALLLDGVDDWVDINDLLLTNFQDKTITMWIKPMASTGTDDEYIFGTNHTRQRCNIFLGGSSSSVSGAVQNKLYAHLAGTDSGGYVIAAPAASVSTLTPGTWYHVAFTVWNRADGFARGELFLDALSQSKTFASTPKLAGPLQGANLGSYSDGTGTGFANVTIDKFRIYDKILDLTAITAVKNGTDTETPWLRYKFDESSGLIAADSGESKGFYIALDSPAETYQMEAKGQRKVNFKDMALMAGNWLDGISIWP